MASNAPAELRAITPFLQRASELKQREPAISYWCSYHAVQVAMALKPTEVESRKFLMSLMDGLEEMKTQAGDDPLFGDDAIAAAYIRSFALKIFLTADNEDRSGKASRGTAKSFLAAANFFELLAIFNQTSSDDADKIKYSKWKASDISKALREGRVPAPGPPGWQPPALEPEPAEEGGIDGVIISKEEEASLRQELQSLGFQEHGREVEEDDEGAEIEEILRPNLKERPKSYSSTTSATPPVLELRPSSPFYSPKFDSAFETSQSLFLGKEKDKPSAPAEEEPDPNGFISVPSAPDLPQVAITPPPQPRSLPSPPLPPSLPSPPPSSAYSPPPVSPPPVRPSYPTYVHPAPAAPILQRAPTLPPKTAGPSLVQQRNVQHEQEETGPLVTEMTPMEIAKVQKHAKWAISALDYEDFETARKELRNALRMLGG
ncbi:DUF605-domain-containing protein [Atractiella rhizophila]|nr:DUF605-domain-containing protein [Atractiella rhizophila]